MPWQPYCCLSWPHNTSQHSGGSPASRAAVPNPTTTPWSEPALRAANTEHISSCDSKKTQADTTHRLICTHGASKYVSPRHECWHPNSTGMLAPKQHRTTHAQPVFSGASAETVSKLVSQCSNRQMGLVPPCTAIFPMICPRILTDIR